MPEVIFDNQEQLEQIQSLLRPRETVEAVFDINDGRLLGLTSKRLITATFGKKGDCWAWSVLYASISWVSLNVNRKEGFLQIAHMAAEGTTFSCPSSHTFRDPSKARLAHDLILHHIL